MSRPVLGEFGATGAQEGAVAPAPLGDPDRRFTVRAVARQPDSSVAQLLRRAGAELIVDLATWQPAGPRNPSSSAT